MTEAVLNFLLRDDAKLAYAIQLSPDVRMLKRWLQTEVEISENSPVLAKLLLQSCLDDIKWHVVLTFLEVRKELGVRRVC